MLLTFASFDDDDDDDEVVENEKCHNEEEGGKNRVSQLITWMKKFFALGAFVLHIASMLMPSFKGGTGNSNKFDKNGEELIDF